MSSYPLISVLVPVYKPPLPYLQKCCEGIFNQTYPNLEVLFYVDGTADECPEMMTYLRDIEDQHDNVRIYTGIKNMGVSYARNYLKSQISDEAYAYVYNDSDDEMDITNILRRYQLMKEKDLDCVFTEFTSRRFKTLDVKAVFWRYNYLPANQLKDAMLFGCSWWANMGASPFLRNTEKTKRIDYCTEFKFGEDLQYVLDLMWKADIKFDIIHEALYHQYTIFQNPDSLTSLESSSKIKLEVDGSRYPFYYTAYKNFWEEHNLKFDKVIADIYTKLHNYAIKYTSVLQFTPEEIKMLNKMATIASKITGKSTKWYLDLIKETSDFKRGVKF